MGSEQRNPFAYSDTESADELSPIAVVNKSVNTSFLPPSQLVDQRSSRYMPRSSASTVTRQVGRDLSPPDAMRAGGR